VDTVLDNPTERLTLDVAADYLSFAQATRYFHPRCHPATLTRWARKGVLCPDGSRLKLRADRIGSKWWTKRDWINKFIAAQTAAFSGSADAPTVRAPAERSRAADAADAELAVAGW
jgi:hypothetical protein